MPKLSIITINYNNLEGLKRTVASVVSQTWQEFEYIIIDGGSTDGSAKYIESFNDNFDYCVSEKDSGIYNAMNKGIKVATGEYLLFLNSGDHLYDNTVLEKNHQLIIEKDLVYFNLNIVDVVRSYIRKYPSKLLFSYLMYDTLPHPSTFIKSTLFDKVGKYDENFKIVSDWKFFIESVCIENASYIRIDNVMSTFYLGGYSSDINNQNLIAEEKKEVLESNFSAYLEDIQELNKQKATVDSLKTSKKINLLVKLGMLNKF
jgi:glycosyltransferase involved in cell wall biosynthesis